MTSKLVPLLKSLWECWAEGNNVPEGALDKWIADPNRTYHCIFCGRHGSLEEAFRCRDLTSASVFIFTACPVCKEYKGVEPCIPDRCECWHLDVIRKLSEGGVK